jgi:hypothetical protein
MACFKFFDPQEHRLREKALEKLATLKGKKGGACNRRQFHEEVGFSRQGEGVPGEGGMKTIVIDGVEPNLRSRLCTAGPRKCSLSGRIGSSPSAAVRPSTRPR